MINVDVTTQTVQVTVSSQPVQVTVSTQGIQGPPADGSSGGMSQAFADSRYVQLSQIDAADGVAGLDANRFISGDRLADPPITLTVLFANTLA